MAVLSAPTPAVQGAANVAVTSFGIVFPPLVANVIPAPAYSGEGSAGGDDAAVGYAS
jgi:hypothetical protein